jgi:hypothetical protein
VKRVRPEIKVIGVQPEDSDAMARSIAAGRRVKLEHVGLFADGVAVKQVGKETFRLVKQYVDEIVLVDTDATCAALKDVFEDTRSVLEPAGALAIAGAKAWVEKHRTRDRTYVAIACGANMNFDRLRFVAERAELGEEREALLAVTIPEHPGSFREFCRLLGKRSVTEFNYRFADPKVAHIFVGIEVANRRETDALLAELERRGIEAFDLSDNEMAKLHVRHLVGGHAPSAERDPLPLRISRAARRLMKFLNSMSRGWNISLFITGTTAPTMAACSSGCRFRRRTGKFRELTAWVTTASTKPGTLRTGCSLGSSRPSARKRAPTDLLGRAEWRRRGGTGRGWRRLWAGYASRVTPRRRKLAVPARFSRIRPDGLIQASLCSRQQAVPMANLSAPRGLQFARVQKRFQEPDSRIGKHGGEKMRCLASR